MNQEEKLKIAIMAHQVNKIWCELNGDYSQPDWGNAPTWQIQSAISGVQHVINNPDAGPSASHDSWLAEKEADGWVYGKVKDPSKKEHPCMVPYDQLPDVQKKKDSLFVAVVKALT